MSNKLAYTFHIDTGLGGTEFKIIINLNTNHVEIRRRNEKVLELTFKDFCKFIKELKDFYFSFNKNTN